jgi:hypothetical protein
MSRHNQAFTGPHADVMDYDSEHGPALGHWDGRAWRLTYRTADEWLPRDCTRDQAADIIVVFRKAYEAGYEEALRVVRRTIGVGK